MGVEIGKVFVTQYPQPSNTSMFPLWLEYGELQVTLPKPLIVESKGQLVLSFQLHDEFKTVHDHLDSTKIIIKIK